MPQTGHRTKSPSTVQTAEQMQTRAAGSGSGSPSNADAGSSARSDGALVRGSSVVVGSPARAVCVLVRSLVFHAALRQPGEQYTA